MTDRQNRTSHGAVGGLPRPRTISRRSVLRGSVKAMPVVLTLHSGAALARSSNLISASGTVDTDGQYRCLDTQTLTPIDGAPDLYDFGEPAAIADVAVIPDRDYYTAPAEVSKPTFPKTALTPNSGWKSFEGRPGTALNKVAYAEQVSALEMCEKGGEYYYEEAGGWNCVRVQQGMLVSSTALSSFAGNLNFPSINNCEL